MNGIEPVVAWRYEMALRMQSFKQNRNNEAEAH
jgi:hypothetical protein